VATAILVGMACLFLVSVNYDRIMGAPDPNSNVQVRYYAPMAIAGSLGGLLTFWGGFGVLHLLGVQAIRPKPDNGG
jgi:hypothetical protein